MRFKGFSRSRDHRVHCLKDFGVKPYPRLDRMLFKLRNSRNQNMLFKEKCNPHHWFPNLSVPLCLEMGETYISPTEVVGTLVINKQALVIIFLLLLRTLLPSPNLESLKCCNNKMPHLTKRQKQAYCRS